MMVILDVFVGETNLRVSSNGGTFIAGWFLPGEIPSFEMDADWGYTPIDGNPGAVGTSPIFFPWKCHG